MANTKQRLLAGGMTLALSFSLVACGGASKEATTTADTGEATTEKVEPAAKVAPSLINPGSLNDSNNTSDTWTTNPPEEDAESIYFTKAANDAGLTVTFVAPEDGSENSVWDLEIVDDHLVTKSDAADDARKVDFVFMDNFTCYDYESDTTYTRGDRSQDDYNALFAGKTFTEDLENPDHRRLELRDDGTCTQSLDGDAIEGEWEVATTNVLSCHYPNEGYSIEFEFEITDDTVDKIDMGGMNGPAYLYELV